MSAVQQALALGAADKAQGQVFDRLRMQLATLDSKTSVLLRFNAIVVAALAYVTMIPGAEPAGGGKALLAVFAWLSHLSLALEVVSCALAFAIIKAEPVFPTLDDSTLRSVGALVDRRTKFYIWSWWLAVFGGLGFALLVAVATFH